MRNLPGELIDDDILDGGEPCDLLWSMFAEVEPDAAHAIDDEFLAAYAGELNELLDLATIAGQSDPALARKVYGKMIRYNGIRSDWRETRLNQWLREQPEKAAAIVAGE